jgi:hypothetical protein
MRVITAVEWVEWNPQRQTEPALFLAGGITDCPDWQAQVVEQLADQNLTLFNPRRPNFPIGDPKAAEEQIVWEFNHLHRADVCLFWFPCETLCPIVLYELGGWSIFSYQMFLGVHPDYKRRQDVEIQTRLQRPDQSIVYSLDDLVAQVKAWLPSWQPLSAHRS